MSHKPNSELPKKSSDDDIHVTPPEGLREVLEDSEDLAKKGQRALDAAVKTRSVVPPTPEFDPDGAEDGDLSDTDEKATDEPERDTSVDLDESEEDLTEAAGVFAASVDTITNALLVILGKLDETTSKQNRLSSRTSLVVFIMLIVVGAMGWSIWRVELIAQQQVAEREARREIAKQQRETTDELKLLVITLRKTNEKVDEVKAEQEKQPDVAIVSDNKGGAKVVIKAKPCNGDKKDCERPLSKLPSAGKKPAFGDGAKIEIPIPGAKTSHPPPPSYQQQGPPPGAPPSQ